MKFKRIVLFLALLQICKNYSQNNTFISGEIYNSVEKKDSIVFTSGFLNSIYFQSSKIIAKLANNKFSIKASLSYPQMYLVEVHGENQMPFLNGFYFLDSSTSKIQIENEFLSSSIDNMIFNEYKEKFIPFYINNDDSMNFIFNDSENFDIKLSKYIDQNPNSYVALWMLIFDIEIKGLTNERFKMFENFSNQIKSEELWKIANLEFEKIKIRENTKFPSFDLKNVNLEQEKLLLPKAEYILIDFWFSRCKPCLEQLPELKNIYNKYNSKGFEIIGISIDATDNVIPYWKKRIIEYEIPWKNYLDENGKIASIEKIINFPTNFFLDKNGVIIKRDISFEELILLLDKIDDK